MASHKSTAKPAPAARRAKPAAKPEPAVTTAVIRARLATLAALSAEDRAEFARRTAGAGAEDLGKETVAENYLPQAIVQALALVRVRDANPAALGAFKPTLERWLYEKVVDLEQALFAQRAQNTGTAAVLLAQQHALDDARAARNRALGKLEVYAYGDAKALDALALARGTADDAAAMNASLTSLEAFVTAAVAATDPSAKFGCAHADLTADDAAELRTARAALTAALEGRQEERAPTAPRDLPPVNTAEGVLTRTLRWVRTVFRAARKNGAAVELPTPGAELAKVLVASRRAATPPPAEAPAGTPTVAPAARKTKRTKRTTR